MIYFSLVVPQGPACSSWPQRLEMAGRIVQRNLSTDLIKRETTAQELSRAIEQGDKETAVECARLLAEQHLPVIVQLKKSAYGQQEIKLRVSVEDSQTTGTIITMKVYPYMTIATLKSKMSKDYGFHPTLQQWIIAQRLGKDQETLSFHGIRKDGDMAYVYLLTAAQAGAARNPRAQLQPDRAQMATDEIRANNEDFLPVLEPRGTQPQLNEARVLPETPKIGWECAGCTYINKPTRPGCEMCSTAKPDNYHIPRTYIPDQEELQRMNEEDAAFEQYEQSMVLERERNYQLILETDDQNLVSASEEFECSICLITLDQREGVTLRECLHIFCKDCLKGTILTCTEADVACPFINDLYSCNSKILEREIKHLLTVDEYRSYLDKSLAIAENSSGNSYHCQTPDCKGWCIYEDEINDFPCPLCKKTNCLVCKAIHEGINCKEYQDNLKIHAQNDEAAKQTAEMLKSLVTRGEAMHCPKCKIVVQKKDGCDWIRCTMCKVEICWVTKGPRWGPQGTGDTSGGCRCRINGQPCHPRCQNCH
ncbi:ranBP-type and C3HC4-type zinc finger-containing protein 1 isoform X2 [Amblyraja radiata]|uniref:ranBP-type and C3HC4-type zinc finger-containing protein 1 isoform X2 n=2 Tax=Amblyraja radiata TaxID=386614 RepID=UPI001402BFAD|nr:ranBP-type and C3HC4-type zinc finger-containing protein 1 isoform X2 [Amblyraja radiata]